MKQIFDKEPVMEANTLKMEDYQPCCYTPLYDAMGVTITKMRDYIRSIENVIVVVTIITNGQKNASKKYTSKSIKSLVESSCGEDWGFIYMETNQNAVDVALNLSIRNFRNFGYDKESEMSYGKDNNTRIDFFSRLHICTTDSIRSYPRI